MVFQPKNDATDHQYQVYGLVSEPEHAVNTSTKTLPTPDLSDSQIMGAVCGLRPCRRGGLKLELEHIQTKKIVHNYGHGGCGVTVSFGTAHIASDIVDQVSTSGDQIAVLGAGVVGLTTARELLNRGYRVSIYSDKVANETTSAIAGALWLPVGIEFGDTPAQTRRMIDILERSQSVFRSLDSNRYGIENLPIYEPATSNTESYLFENGLIAPPTPIDSFPFECIAEPGRMFTTEFIHTNRFLDSIYDDVINLGGQFHKHKFETIDQVLEIDEIVIVNCLALGSRKLFADDAVYAARGVLVHLQPQNLGYAVHDGYKYMFPRENALVLGGCFEEDVWDNQPNQAMIDEILNHHRRFFGQLDHI